MEAYQQRVVDELSNLSEKLTKLEEFILSDTFAGLNGLDRMLLLNQRRYMDGYLFTLEMRVEEFGDSDGR